MEPYNDKHVWNHTTSGHPSLKDAYSFTSQHYHQVDWHKIIWNQPIPPSFFTLIWRIFHRKMPTDKNLMIRCCYFPSMCTLCRQASENARHIFIDCAFASKLWSWIQNIYNQAIDFTSFISSLNIYKKRCNL